MRWSAELVGAYIVVALLLAGVGMQLYASWQCYPQRGEWGPLHGVLCYGGEP